MAALLFMSTAVRAACGIDAIKGYGDAAVKPV